MTRQYSLRERAATCGIALEYTDARGAVVQVNDDVLAKLLASLGQAESDIQTTIMRRLLTCLVLTPKAGRIEVPLPTATTGKTVGWRLLLEDGTVQAGTSE